MNKLKSIQPKYVSRAGLKLELALQTINIDFKNKVVLDIGSSTGGFSDYALRAGAKKIIAVDKGTNQLAHELRRSSYIEIHEKTDIRDFKIIDKIDIILVDVSFISIFEIISSIVDLSNKQTNIVIMIKPQFEASDQRLLANGVIKNEKIRRALLSSVERRLKNDFYIVNKSDSKLSGKKGNIERFYHLRPL